MAVCLRQRLCLCVNVESVWTQFLPNCVRFCSLPMHVVYMGATRTIKLTSSHFMTSMQSGASMGTLEAVQIYPIWHMSRRCDLCSTCQVGDSCCS